MKITLEKQTLTDLEKLVNISRSTGDLRTMNRIRAILSLIKGIPIETIASVLRVCTESIRVWFKSFVQKGVAGLKSEKSPGRPPKLTKLQRKELKEIIIAGPVDAGYIGACWRSPMIQDIIQNKFGVFYSVHYLSQLLKNMGFSFQKAKFVSDHKDPEKREEWLKTKWPEIITKAKLLNAMILFGDEASFPQWGTLAYTWALRGQQPTVKTSGIRKGYKVFGLIDYFSGTFFFKGQETRFNSASYIQYLTEVLEKTKQHIILIQDGARYHTSKAMQEFFAKHSEKLTVYQLPSYSPDYNPIEKLWKKIKEDGTHLHYFPTFEDLVRKVNEILPSFEMCREKVLSLFELYKGLEI